MSQTVGFRQLSLSPAPPVGKPGEQKTEIAYRSDYFGKVALVAGAQADETFSVLGTTLFKRLYQAYVPEETFRKLWMDAGLDPDFLPRSLPCRRAYLKATEEFKHERGVDNIPLRGHFRCSKGKDHFLDGLYTVRTMVRTVANTKERIVRHVVREVVDGQNTTLFLSTVGEAVFLKKEQRPIVHWFGLSEAEREVKLYKQLEARFWASYELHQTHFDADHFRQMVDGVLRKNKAILLEGGTGTHFLPRSRMSIGDQLKTFIDSLGDYAVGSKPLCFPTPTVDANVSREHVKTSFRKHQEELMNDLLERLQALRRSKMKKSIVIERARKAVEETRREMTALMTEYQELLSESLDAGSWSLRAFEIAESDLNAGELPELAQQD